MRGHNGWVSLNVEMIGKALIVQNYRYEVAEPDSAAVGRFQGRGHEIGCGVVDRRVSAESASDVGTVVGAGGGDDGRPNRMCPLDREGADSAGSTVDEHTLAIVQPGDHGEIGIHRARRLRNDRRLCRVQIGRDGQHLRGRDGDLLGVAAAVEQCAHPVTDSEVIDVRAHSDDVAGTLQAQNGLSRSTGGISTPTTQQIGVVDSGCFDADHHFMLGCSDLG